MPVAMQNEAAGEYEAAFAVATRQQRWASASGCGSVLARRPYTGPRSDQAGADSGRSALLDEAMLAASSGELSPIITGVVYCGVIAAARKRTRCAVRESGPKP